MTVASIDPVQADFIESDYSIQFEITHTGATEVLVTAQTEEVWRLTSGGQAGYTVVAVTVGEVTTITFTRDAGWTVSPLILQVDITGGIYDGESTSWSYYVGAKTTYPIQDPYNPALEKDFTVLQDGGEVLDGVTILDTDSASLSVIKTGTRKVKFFGVGSASARATDVGQFKFAVAAPGAGEWRIDSGNLEIADTSDFPVGKNVETWVRACRPMDIITVFNPTGTKYQTYLITDFATDATGYWQLPVTEVQTYGTAWASGEVAVVGYIQTNAPVGDAAYRVITSGTPTAGQIISTEDFATAPSAVTSIDIHKSGVDGVDWGALLAVAGTKFITLAQGGAGGRYQVGTVVDNDPVYTLPLTYIAGSGNWIDDPTQQLMLVQFDVGPIDDSAIVQSDDYPASISNNPIPYMSDNNSIASTVRVVWQNASNRLVFQTNTHWIMQYADPTAPGIGYGGLGWTAGNRSHGQGRDRPIISDAGGALRVLATINDTWSAEDLIDSGTTPPPAGAMYRNSLSAASTTLLEFSYTNAHGQDCSDYYKQIGAGDIIKIKQTKNDQVTSASDEVTYVVQSVVDNSTYVTIAVTQSSGGLTWGGRRIKTTIIKDPNVAAGGGAQGWIDSGWLDPTDAVLSWDDGTATLTMTVTGTKYVWVGGSLVAITTDSIQVDSGTPSVGEYYFYIDSAGDLQYTQTFDPTTLIYDNCLVAALYWSTTDSEAITGLMSEQHGFEMPSAVHSWAHRGLGALHTSGAALTMGSTSGNGDDDAHARFSGTAFTFVDEDIDHSGLAKGLTDNIDVYYLSGTEWRRLGTADEFPFVKGTNRAYFNQITGGSGSLVEVGSNNDYVLAHIYLKPGAATTSGEYIAIMGQNEYATTGQAEDGALVEAQSLELIGLPAPELCLIGTIIGQTGTGYTNAVATRIRPPANGDYVDWRSNVGGGGVGGATTLPTTPASLTLGAAATTFAITSGFMVITGDAGANTIATITGAQPGQELTLLFVDANVTITNDNTHAADSVDLSAAFTSADDTILRLIYDGTSWYEVSRSVN